MPRVIGIDLGTISVDVCGIDEGSVFVDRSLSTREVCSNPNLLVAALESVAPLDLIVGPSGYGLPLKAARDLTDDDLRLAYLAADGEEGGIGGVRSLLRTLARYRAPILLVPGAIHLQSVPPHRKVNRIDIGTADKVCAVALAIDEQAHRLHCSETDVSLILLELGGAFSAALAVEGGRIVDGLGGTSGPLGMEGSGALDGEVAFLAGKISKDLLFYGGAVTIAGLASGETLAIRNTAVAERAWDAYLESAIKAVATLNVSVPAVHEVVVSGRWAAALGVMETLTQRLATMNPRYRVRPLAGFAAVAKEGAQGAALLADGLAGGKAASLVDAMGIREASGTALDHLYVISPATARKRLGMSS